MGNLTIKVICLFIMASLWSYALSQVPVPGTQPAEITADLLRKQAEISEGTSVLNVLTVSNPALVPVSLTVHYNIPDGWSFIGTRDQEIMIGPGDSVQIPFRIAPSPGVTGGVAYPVGVTLSNHAGNEILTAHFYIRVREESNLRIRPSERIRYMDKSSGNSSLELFIRNQGNITERINLRLHYNSPLYLEEGVDNLFADYLEVPPKTDTLVVYQVRSGRITSGDPPRLQKVMVEAVSGRDSFQTAVWFRRLDNSFRNSIDESRRVLIVDLVGQNLLSRYSPYIMANISGNLLLPSDRSVYYYYRNMGSESAKNPWKYSRLYAGFRTGNAEIHLGDVFTGIGQSMVGRGIMGNYGFRDYHLQGILTRNLFRDETHAGASLSGKLGGNSSWLAGGGYSKDNTRKTESMIGLAETQLRLGRNHRLGTMLALSSRKHFYDSIFNKAGMGINVFYYGSLTPRWKLDIWSKYGSPDFTGFYSGRWDFRVNSLYSLNNLSQLELQVLKNLYNPSVYAEDSLLPRQKINLDEFWFRYNVNLSPRFYLFGGPIWRNQQSNSFYPGIWNDRFFGSHTLGIKSGFRLRGEKAYQSLNLTLTLGMNRINRFSPEVNPYTILQRTEGMIFPSSELFVNFRQLDWGIRLNYYYGPYNIYQQFGYFYYDRFFQSISISPYLEKFLFNKQLRLEAKATYRNDVSARTERVNLNLQAEWYMKKGWTLHLLNNSNLNTRYDAEREDYLSYKYNYLEFGVKKVFGFQQPRMKYYDLEVSFFKDINGNHIRDKEEPGIRNVLFTIEKPPLDSLSYLEEESRKAFVSTDMLSDQFGNVTYHNIPEGDYIVSFTPLDGVDEYTYYMGEEQQIRIGSNLKLDIPFRVSNKLYGKVSLKRNQFSALGRIDLSNIRVTATDNLGNAFSTLSNKAGEYLLYLPGNTTYRVKISNVFYEHFDLVQDSFTLDFTGYKQYEVNFVFIEKERKIIFEEERLP